MKKTSLILVFSFISLFSLGTLAMVNYQPELKKRLKETYSSLLEETVHSETTETSEPLPLPVEIVKAIELPVMKGKLSKDSYEDHLNAAEFRGVGLIRDQLHLDQLVNNRILVEVSAGEGYKVDSLTHSYPFLTLHSKKVLEDLGRTFQALAGDESFFTVSSTTRTIEQQKNLAKRNRNATAGNSSHSYGVSFDISYIRFNGVKGSNARAQNDLEAVLNHFQKENKIFVIKERKQSCYHITVR